MLQFQNLYKLNAVFPPFEKQRNIFFNYDFFFFKEFQLIMSTPNDNSLSLNQDINRFWV